MGHHVETADGGVTHYLDLVGPRGTKHPVAVFIPTGFRLTAGADLILYLHGYTASDPGLRSYLQRPPIRAIRAAVGAHGRFALAIPYLGARSDAAFLVATADAFESYCAQILQIAADHAPGAAACLARVPPGVLILAGHSGGGVGLLRAARLPAPLIGRVAEVWAFDCFYSGEGPSWIAWARSHPTARLRAVWRHNPHDSRGDRTATEGQRIGAAGLPNVTSEESTVPHDAIPGTYVPRFLADLPASPQTPLRLNP